MALKEPATRRPTLATKANKVSSRTITIAKREQRRRRKIQRSALPHVESDELVRIHIFLLPCNHVNTITLFYICFLNNVAVRVLNIVPTTPLDDLQGLTRPHKVSQGLTRSHKASQGFTRSHKVSQSLTRHHKVSQGPARSHTVSQGFRCQLNGDLSPPGVMRRV